MEIKQTLVLDSSDSLSKALQQLDQMPAVIVTKNGKYFGIIDHRSISQGIKDPHSIKCENAMVKPPVLFETAGLLERVDAFLLGHFKALPVVGEDERPLGITTRVELLQDMVREGLMPKMEVDELMGSPVYAVNDQETVGSAKRIIKEKKVHRLIVTRNSNLIGVISTYDIGAWSTKPNMMASGRKDIKPGEQIKTDNMLISSFLRPDVTLVKEGSSIEDAAKRMVRKNVSTVIVVADKRPLGVLSATDIFKKVQELSQEGVPIAVSGLRDENIGHYAHIKNRIGHVLEKFSKSFAMRNVSVHVKEGKSTFVVNLYFDMDKGHVAIKEERGDLKETIDEVAAELNNVLRKRKEMKKVKPRVTHAH